MYWKDHGPPHFHALYAEYEVLVDIRTLTVIEGYFPNRAMSLVSEWARIHRDDLMEDWRLCETLQQPHQIPPLP